MITVTHTITALPKTMLCLPNDQLEGLCLKLPGGCQTEKKTIVGMCLALNVRSTGKAKYMAGKITITMTNNEE